MTLAELIEFTAHLNEDLIIYIKDGEDFVPLSEDNMWIRPKELNDDETTDTLSQLHDFLPGSD